MAGSGPGMALPDGARPAWSATSTPPAAARESAVFAYYVERNRLLMLVKDAPADLAAAQIWRYLLVTASYARRDVVAPVLAGRRPRPTVVARRLRSLGSFVGLLGPMVRERRALRSRQLVADDDLGRWRVSR